MGPTLTKMKFGNFKRSLGFRIGQETESVGGKASLNKAQVRQLIRSTYTPSSALALPLYYWMAPDRVCNEYVMKGN